MNKIIVIEGTDCSGKATQSDLLIKRFAKEGIELGYFSFPNYNSPTGKIVGGSYLGKQDVDENGKRLFPDPVFKEGATKVDPKVASMIYALDRLYNMPELKRLLEMKHMIVDRYVYSNMAHQGGKLEGIKERKELYKYVDELEFGLNELPIPDARIFLHMPYEYACKLKKNRKFLDQHEVDKQHLINAEKAYLEIAELGNFKTIECVRNHEIRTEEDINEEVYQYVKSKLK